MVCKIRDLLDTAQIRQNRALKSGKRDLIDSPQLLLLTTKP